MSLEPGVGGRVGRETKRGRSEAETRAQPKRRVLVITGDGVVVIKAQESRSQERNRADAVARLVALVHSVAHTPKPRRPTRPTRASQQRRLEGKALRGNVKTGRSRVTE